MEIKQLVKGMEIGVKTEKSWNANHQQDPSDRWRRFIKKQFETLNMLKNQKLMMGRKLERLKREKWEEEKKIRWMVDLTNHHTNKFIPINLPIVI